MTANAQLTLLDAPMVRLAQASHRQRPRPCTLAQTRAAARAMCAGCDVKQVELKNQYTEPAWEIIKRKAGAVCAECSLRDLPNLKACAECPGVLLLTKLMEGTDG